jgi:hypothetical protein
MKVLIPITVTDAMFTACSVAEPAASETTWVSAGTYAVDDRRIRTGVHRKFKCILAHTGRTALPEADPLYWEDEDPTIKWAAFDTYVSTALSGASPLSFTVNTGFAQDISMYGLTGTSVTIVEKDAPAGTTLETRTVSLYAESPGLYEYLFGPKNPKSKIIETGFALRPNAEYTITITGSGTVAVGMCNFGAYRSVLGEWGGTTYGCTVEPISASRIKTNETTGKVSIKRGTAATNMRITVQIPIEAANYALQTMQEVLDVPVSVVGSDAVNYEGLNVFGLPSSQLLYPGYGLATLSTFVKGMF